MVTRACSSFTVWGTGAGRGRDDWMSTKASVADVSGAPLG